MPTTPPRPPGDPPRPSTFQTRPPPPDSPQAQTPAYLHRDSQLDPEAAAAASVSEHPYLRLYQYLHHKNNLPGPQEADHPQPHPSQGPSLQKTWMARPVTHAAASGPPAQHLSVGENRAPQAASDFAPSSPRPPPPGSRRGNAPSPPTLSPYHKHKTFLSSPNNTPPLPSKPPPSPGNRRRPPTSGGNPPPASSCGTPISLSVQGSDAGQDVQHQVTASNKRNSPGGHTPTRGMAPPPPSTPQLSKEAPRATPPSRDATAPPVQVREAPPPPPVRSVGSPCLSSDHPVRVKPPAPPPPPPPKSGNASPTCSTSCLNTDFEARFSFHGVEDFPPPEIFRLLSNVYPSKTQKVMRGAPPLPPVGR